MELQELGTVKHDGKLVVADPCYVPQSLTPFLTAKVEVQPGEWDAFVELSDEGIWGTRVRRLVLSADGRDPEGSKLRGELGSERLGVDSGQMMIASAEAIANWGSGEFEEPLEDHAGETNYSAACHVTLSDRAGVFADGRAVVSSSGYGDGVYPLTLWRNDDGSVVAMDVVFFDGNDEDEEEEDYEEEEDDDFED